MHMIRPPAEAAVHVVVLNLAEGRRTRARVHAAANTRI